MGLELRIGAAFGVRTALGVGAPGWVLAGGGLVTGLAVVSAGSCHARSDALFEFFHV